MEFYPASLPVPAETRTDRLWLRPLRASDVELDYDAVMENPAALRRWSQSTWPADDFTVAENLEDLERHEREHLAREAFTFTVLDSNGTRCLGCVYIQPVGPEAAELCGAAVQPTNVGFWVRASEWESDLDRHLLDTLRAWFESAWAFDRVIHLVSVKEERQAELMREAGLELRGTVEKGEGRTCWAVG